MSIRARGRKSYLKKAGLKFSIGRIHRIFKQRHRRRGRVNPKASVYLAAVVQVLCAEVLDLAATSAKNKNNTRIIPKDLDFVVVK